MDPGLLAGGVATQRNRNPTFNLALPILATLLASALGVTGCLRGTGVEGFADPHNDIVIERPQDVSFLDVGAARGQLTQEWQVRIPWSRDGLGWSDEYLGIGEGGVPLGGGVFPPEGVVVGPGPVIAVNNGGGTRLYDGQGRFLGERPGSPRGFLPDGSLVTSGPSLVAYARDGSELWRRDPWSEAVAKLAGGKKAEGFSLPAIVSPAGEVYVYVHLSLPDRNLDALVVCGPEGEPIYCDLVPATAALLFGREGTAISGAVTTARGEAYREFSVNGATFDLVRTLYLPGGGIQTLGADGSLVCRNPDVGDSLIECYTVYRPEARTALTFNLPEGHHFAASTLDGRLYTSLLLRDSFVVTAWIWPVP